MSPPISPPPHPLQPPFPPTAIAPDPNPPPHHQQAAESLVNTAAQHVAPTCPPTSDESPQMADQATNSSDDSLISSRQTPQQEETESAIISGTLPDEMEPAKDAQTVRFSSPSPASSSTHKYPTEVTAGLNEPLMSSRAPSTASSQTPESSPDFRASRDIGSMNADRSPPFFILAVLRIPVIHNSSTTPPASVHVQQIRMGASALVSALNALPWEEDDESDDGEDDDEFMEPARGSSSAMYEKKQRPQISRLGSSLSTIRPMSSSSPTHAKAPSTSHGSHPTHTLHFPFRQNAIARRARRPGTTELDYQYATPETSSRRTSAAGSEASSEGEVPLPKGFVSHPNLIIPSGEGEAAAHADLKLINDRICKEQQIADVEEQAEILRSAEEQRMRLGKEFVRHKNRDSADLNVDAALREGGSEGDDVIEEQMQTNEAEKRITRKERLAERLMEVFGLEEREQVLEEMKCWLLRSVMLKGYMYLTKKHICFFANMPNENNLLVKSGPLSKKASRSKLNTKFWVVLKNDVLSWYESTSDPYFPKGNISLQYCHSCDAVDGTRFKVRTSERNYTFTADTESSRDEWVKAIQKVMFKTQHEGETIKLIIPLEAVVDVDMSPTLEFTETIEIKCIDAEDQMSVDSYFFASFPNNDHAFSAIQKLVRERPSPPELPRISSATTIHANQESLDTSHATIKRHGTDSSAEKLVMASHRPFRKISSILKPLILKSSGEEPHEEHSESPHHDDDDEASHLPHIEAISNRQRPEEESDNDDFDGYPPRQIGPPPPSMNDDARNWRPSWIRKPASKLFGNSPSGSFVSHPGRSPTDSPTTVAESGPSLRSRTGRTKQSSVTEVLEPPIHHEEEGSEDEMSSKPSVVDSNSAETARKRAARLSWTSETSSGSQMIKSKSEFSMLGSESGHSESAETIRKFRSFFALSDKEDLIDHFPGYLYRVLPMIIPIRDLYGLKAQKAFRFGHSGLTVVIKGHEEIFIEFRSASRRKACIILLEERMEAVRLSGENTTIDSHKVEVRIMEDLDESIPVEPKSPWPVSPSPLFGSTTSTSFLEFKPEPMKIACLTIGSRGDVQPYIALCKGLQAEGHTTKIATHGEYKDWVEGHGIAFENVGGDPAELMQMCVDNGMFTVSFLKEGLQKFRGWLDDLLNSSWEACQGSDLLIESPSAMSGIHIAEALRIPYYRAFTMPWTRTRAYPHAFAVPEHGRGGPYNYMTYTMFDQVFWRAISGQVNRWRRNVLGLDATTFDKMEQHKVPFLYNFSPTVVPPPLDWTEWIHVTGYWFLDKADEKQGEKSWTPPQGLTDFIDKAHGEKKKVVYIGFGSIVVSDPEEMTRCVVEAVMNSGVCAILSKGWSDRGSKKGEPKGDSEGADGVKYPPEIFAIDSIDHGWLFPRIDAACHHGGAGTTGASLRAGIPTIIKPFFGDQAFWAERVESLNVGSAIRRLTSHQLASALIKATTDEKQISKARVVGEMIRKENGIARAIEAIYRDLEYAKSIIKSPPSTDDRTPEKISSLLHPLTTADLSLNRVRSRSRSRSRSSQGRFSPRRYPVDDDGWSVVSGGSRSRSGSASAVASPERRPLNVGSTLGSHVFKTALLPNPFGKWRNLEEGDDR
ncbi:sterol 3-beta-glucosyltransferase [Cryptococcus neoformans var. grubii Br795]|nr:sterol 3-beta-glucosyltransferase [Cryptococcus neoformans var. grubii Br795]